MRVEANTTDLPILAKAGVPGDRITVSNPKAVAVRYIFAPDVETAVTMLAEGDYYVADHKTEPVSHEFEAGENLYTMSASRREHTYIYVTG